MFTENTVISAPSSPSNLSSVTLVGSAGSGSNSGSDRSPQDGGTYSRGVSEETDTPVTSEPPSDGKLCKLVNDNLLLHINMQSAS